jgi:hypothetical protein
MDLCIVEAIGDAKMNREMRDRKSLRFYLLNARKYADRTKDGNNMYKWRANLINTLLNYARRDGSQYIYNMEYILECAENSLLESALISKSILKVIRTMSNMKGIPEEIKTLAKKATRTITTLRCKPTTNHAMKCLATLHSLYAQKQLTNGTDEGMKKMIWNGIIYMMKIIRLSQLKKLKNIFPCSVSYLQLCTGMFKFRQTSVDMITEGLDKTEPCWWSICGVIRGLIEREEKERQKAENQGYEYKNERVYTKLCELNIWLVSPTTGAEFMDAVQKIGLTTRTSVYNTHALLLLAISTIGTMSWTRWTEKLNMFGLSERRDYGDVVDDFEEIYEVPDPAFYKCKHK